jgi:hypothetical protein
MSKASEFVPVRTIGDATKFALSVFSALSGLLSVELVLDLVGTPILQGRVLGILGGLVFMIVSTYCLFYVWSARVVSNLRGLGREEVTGLMWVRGSLAAPDDPDWHSYPLPQVVIWWAVLSAVGLAGYTLGFLVIFSVVSMAVLTMFLYTGDQAFSLGIWLLLVGATATSVAGLIAIAVIKRVNRGQETLGVRHPV